MTDSSRDAGPSPAEPLRRFYKAASVGAPAGGVVPILLDGRPIRTPSRKPLAAPAPVAERIAAEWNAQGEFILPATMPLTRLANTAIDGVEVAIDAVAGDIAAIAGNDLVVYRAAAPAGLAAAQSAQWDPYVRRAEEAHGVRLFLTEGVMPVRQDPRLAQRVLASLPRDPLVLAALHQFATLTGSALITLALSRMEVTSDEAWTAAHVDEDWNIAAWGVDAEAASRRIGRRRDAEAAAFVLAQGH